MKPFNELLTHFQIGISNPEAERKIFWTLQTTNLYSARQTLLHKSSPIGNPEISHIALSLLSLFLKKIGLKKILFIPREVPGSDFKDAHEAFIKNPKVAFWTTWAEHQHTSHSLFACICVSLNQALVWWNINFLFFCQTASKGGLGGGGCILDPRTAGLKQLYDELTWENYIYFFPQFLFNFQLQHSPLKGLDEFFPTLLKHSISLSRRKQHIS